MIQTFILIIAFVFCTIIPTFAQLSGGSSNNGSMLDGSSMMEAASKSALQDIEKLSQGVSDNVIIAKFYLVGPGDVLSLYTGVSIDLPEIPLIISPESSILLPFGGEVSLKGKTLQQVKDTITFLFKKRNPKANPSIILKRPRAVMVSIAGNVLLPSTSVRQANLKVSSIAKLSNQPGASQTSSDINARYTQMVEVVKKSEKESIALSEGSLHTYSARNIRVLHKDGTVQLVDIIQGMVNPESDSDPYIREGDDIFVPFVPNQYPKVSISGAVARPIEVAFKQGDKASLLFMLCRGLNDDFDRNSIQLFKPGSDAFETLNVDDAGNLLSDVPLENGSRIIVGRKKSTESQSFSSTGIVQIEGEVVTPGNFIIEPNKTRLKDVIEKAGGFNPEAALNLAKIFRKYEILIDPVEILKRRLQEIQFNEITPEDTVFYLVDQLLKSHTVSCNFVNAFTKNIADDNVLLEDGDRIIIPKTPKSIYVYGQLKEYGYVDFVPNKNMEWYINRAGGYLESADRDRARIIKGRNFVTLVGEDEVYLEPGDVIYVPKPTPMPTMYRAQQIGAYGGIISSAAFLVSTIITLFR
jgi:protein involved in polysaccharide export with SLBB domain